MNESNDSTEATVVPLHSLALMVQQHLQYNMYPPVNLGMTPFVIEAIGRCAGGEGHEPVHIQGTSGTMSVPAYQMVEDLHLEWFVDNYDLWDEAAS